MVNCVEDGCKVKAGLKRIRVNYADDFKREFTACSDHLERVLRKSMAYTAHTYLDYEVYDLKGESK